MAALSTHLDMCYEISVNVTQHDSEDCTPCADGTLPSCFLSLLLFPPFLFRRNSESVLSVVAVFVLHFCFAEVLSQCFLLLLFPAFIL